MWNGPSLPTTVRGSSQDRGNSGVYIQSLYEMQVLDSYNQPTYADGQAAAIYGQWPPLVNPIRPPGQWNTYDIVFEAPKFEGDKLVKAAYVTNFFNGIVVHNRKELNGSTEHRALGNLQTPRRRAAAFAGSRPYRALSQHLDSGPSKVTTSLKSDINGMPVNFL